MDMIKVVCGLIYRGEKIFICRRNPEKSLGGFWEFPGGKVEPGEAERECLIRELHEELGMQVSVGRHFKTVIHYYDKFTIELISYVCQFQTATFTLVDHDAYEWVDILSLQKKKLAPADVSIANEILNRESH